MKYEDYLEMLDGHTFAFFKNEQGESTTVSYNPNGWIKVQTVKSDGTFKTENYFKNGNKEEY